MSDCVVVYESVYGDTRAVAEAVAEGLGGAEAVHVHDAQRAIAGARLIVVGGPTHMHGLARRAACRRAWKRPPSGRAPRSSPT
jgi:flavodoxin